MSFGKIKNEYQLFVIIFFKTYKSVFNKDKSAKKFI